MAFECEFQHTPVSKIVTFQCSTPLIGMTFCRHVPNSPRNKNMKRFIPCLFKKWFSWPPKPHYLPQTQGILFYLIKSEQYGLTKA